MPASFDAQNYYDGRVARDSCGGVFGPSAADCGKCSYAGNRDPGRDAPRGVVATAGVAVAVASSHADSKSSAP